jgi:RNA polymerase sigma-70 factor, ECF subfamily
MNLQEIDKEILIKAQNGDIESFETVYKDNAGFVYNVARRMLNNNQDAEEVTQEVFLSVYHSLKSFAFNSSFRTWVYRITVNCSLNYIKKMNREKNRMKEYGENLMHEGNTFSPPEVEKSMVDKVSIVSSLLGVLDPQQRACIVLRNIEGLSYRQISEALKVNINTVRSRLKRAREKLLNLNKEAEYEY